MSFAAAFALQSELAYAERVLSPAIKAGEAVEASREADEGWEDADVQMVATALAVQVLPSVRYLATNAAVDQWRTSSIEVGGTEIGKTRARRLADGRVELGFWTADGEGIEPEVRYLPADPPSDVWLRSGEIEVLLE